ncbi:MAG: hypothetical protein H7Y88_06135 [Phycisphaerales bacterium]|nr:hypothetical protein [Phycisphaerales bacterium]
MDSRPWKPHEVERLLKLLDLASQQERSVKDEENRWIGAYWLFFAAVVYFLTTPKADAEGVKGVVVAASTLGTVLFTWHFYTLRQTYYGIRRRLIRYLKFLRVDVANEWSTGEAKDLSGLAQSDVRAWIRVTKPFHTFLQRISLLVIAHCVVLAVSRAGWAWWGAVVTVTNAAVVFLVDHRAFSRRPLIEPMTSGTDDGLRPG